MKLYLISDNTETYEGMRLAGVDGVVTDSARTVVKALTELAANSEYGIILITEKAYSLAAAEVDRFMATHARPLVTRIPDRHGGSDKQSDVSRFIRDGIGLQI